MNFKTTGILILALVGLLGYYFWSQAGVKPVTIPVTQGISAVGEGRVLFPFNALNVDRISILPRDGKRTTIERVHNIWTMTEPVQAPAAEQPALAMVDALLQLRSRGQPESDPGTGSGLANPLYRVEIHTNDGKTSTLVIGDKAGMGDLLYAQVDGGEIDLIDGTTATALDEAETGLRDPHLLRFNREAIRQIELDRDDLHLVLGDFGGQWKIVRPQNLPADEDTVQNMLANIGDVSATEFVDPGSDELAYARFDHPMMVLRLSTRPPATQPATAPSDLVLTFGAPDSLVKDHYFVRTGDGVFAKVSSTVVDGLAGTTVLAMRDRRLASIAPDSVTDIRITTSTYPVSEPGSAQPVSSAPIEQVVTELRRSAMPAQGPSTHPSRPFAEWQFVTQPAGPVDVSKVEAFLAAFQPLRAENFIDAATGPLLKKYSIVLTTSSRQFQLDVEMRSGSDQADATFNGLVFLVSGELQDALMGDFHQMPGEMQ